MAFDERSYSGKLFRPSPEIYIQDDLTFGTIVTSWGSKSSAKRIADILTDYILSARQDMEATSPFHKLTCLSPLANTLRAGLMLANDTLFREDNKAEYHTGVEVLVFGILDGEFAYAQVGQPNIFIARKDRPWTPLSIQCDFATEMSLGSAIMAPVPQNLIGLHNTTNMNIGSFRVQNQDRIVFLSHSMAVHPLYQLAFDQTDIDHITECLAKGYPDLPFWLGILDLNSKSS